MTSIAIGTITIVMLNGYIEIIHAGLKSDAIMHQTGHFQIAKAGYFEEGDDSPDHLLGPEIFNKIRNELIKEDSVEFINMRLQLGGLIGNQKRSAIFSAIAGDPVGENIMAPTLTEGSLLSDSDPYGIVIGELMAEKLNLKVGDPVILFVATPNGSQEAIAVTIRGIYDALMPEQEKVMIYISLKAAWDLILEKKVHRIVVLLDSLSVDNNELLLPELTNKIKTFIENEHLPLEVRTWDDLSVMYRQIVGMFQGVASVIGLIIFLVIIFNIQNTMQISIQERYREIGALRAMGASRGEIMRSFIVEGFYIGLIGALIGIAIAVTATPLINAAEITLPPGPGNDKPTPVMFDITTAIIANALLLNIITATIASIFPSRRGARIKIADALRYL